MFVRREEVVSGWGFLCIINVVCAARLVQLFVLFLNGGGFFLKGD